MLNISTRPGSPTFNQKQHLLENTRTHAREPPHSKKQLCGLLCCVHSLCMWLHMGVVGWWLGKYWEQLSFIEDDSHYARLSFSHLRLLRRVTTGSVTALFNRSTSQHCHHGPRFSPAAMFCFHQNQLCYFLKTSYCAATWRCRTAQQVSETPVTVV